MSTIASGLYAKDGFYKELHIVLEVVTAGKRITDSRPLTPALRTRLINKEKSAHADRTAADRIMTAHAPIHLKPLLIDSKYECIGDE